MFLTQKYVLELNVYNNEKESSFFVCKVSTCDLCIVNYLWLPLASIRFSKFILEADHNLNALKCPKGGEKSFYEAKGSKFQRKWSCVLLVKYNATINAEQ